MYYQSLKQFKEIIGTSLLEIDDVRLTNIITPDIPFNLSKKELITLHEDSGCDYLINISGKILTQNAGISFNSDPFNHYATNEAKVSLAIYNLKNGELLSASEIFGKVEERGSEFRNNDIPRLATSSHNIMLTGAKKLINKYKKYQIK
ncbi:hypothetical protein ACKGJY_10225 [Hyunsoonleella sp. 2307UL5-6]|uniref:hypothetical protein n=1 Tax=Hyunsoonleella sp. 2307UL5-6 TaxID=3384768 RepID=UPI0039BD720A